MSATVRKHPESGPGRDVRRTGLGGILAVLVAVGIGTLNLSATDRTPTVLGLLAVVPFLAASLSGVPSTFISGVFAVCLALMFGDYDHALWSRDMVVIVSGVAAATVTATVSAAVKRHRMRQLRNTRAVADVVQRTLLRPVPSTVDDVTVAAHYASATRGAQVGGDVFEVLSTPYGMRAFVGDVKGKGLPAVHLASVALGAFREWCYQSPTMAGLAQQLDVSIARNAGPEEFVTGALVQIDGVDAEIVNCGHPAPALMSGGTVALVEPPDISLPLGLGVTAQPYRRAFAPGDRLVIFTDGVSEARRRGRFFDVAGALRALDEWGGDELVRRLHRRLAKFTRRRLADDVAILVLQREGLPEDIEDLATPARSAELTAPVITPARPAS